MRRLLFPLLFATVALASCGGGDDGQDVEGLLDQAFGSQIRSADMELDATLQLEGAAAFERPVRIQASGPFVTGERTLPSVDFELRIGSDGGGQTVSTGILLTGKRAFIKFQDVFYEQPQADVRRANRLLRGSQGRDSSLAELGFDPRRWLAEASDEGEADVAGVETRHVSGSLDVTAMLKDYNGFLRKSGDAVGGATGQTPPPPLSPEQIATVTDAVENPSFDIYVGKEDDTIRRVSGRLKFEVPEAARSQVEGVESGSIQFSLELADVNGDQEIEAPANARPLSALTRSLGGGSALGGLTGGDGDTAQPPADGTAEGVAPSDPPAGDGSEQGQAPPDVATGTTPEADDFRRYADCLDGARPEDTEALQRCAELLDRP